MDNPLQMLLPIVGFIGGIFLWSRVAHLVIALSGLTPNASKTKTEPAALEKAYRRLVLLIAAGWLMLTGGVLAYVLYTDKTGWALLFAGVFGVPLFTVANFLLIVRRHRSRRAGPESQSSN